MTTTDTTEARKRAAEELRDIFQRRVRFTPSDSELDDLVAPVLRVTAALAELTAQRDTALKAIRDVNESDEGKEAIARLNAMARVVNERDAAVARAAREEQAADTEHAELVRAADALRETRRDLSAVLARLNGAAQLISDCEFAALRTPGASLLRERALAFLAQHATPAPTVSLASEVAARTERCSCVADDNSAWSKCPKCGGFGTILRAATPAPVVPTPEPAYETARWMQHLPRAQSVDHLLEVEPSSSYLGDAPTAAPLQPEGPRGDSPHVHGGTPHGPRDACANCGCLRMGHHLSACEGAGGECGCPRFVEPGSPVSREEKVRCLMRVGGFTVAFPRCTRPRGHLSRCCAREDGHEGPCGPIPAPTITGGTLPQPVIPGPERQYATGAEFVVAAQAAITPRSDEEISDIIASLSGDVAAAPPEPAASLTPYGREFPYARIDGAPNMCLRCDEKHTDHEATAVWCSDCFVDYNAHGKRGTGELDRDSAAWQAFRYPPTPAAHEPVEAAGDKQPPKDSPIYNSSIAILGLGFISKEDRLAAELIVIEAVDSATRRARAEAYREVLALLFRKRQGAIALVDLYDEIERLSTEKETGG